MAVERGRLLRRLFGGSRRSGRGGRWLAGFVVLVVAAAPVGDPRPVRVFASGGDAVVSAGGGGRFPKSEHF